MQPSSKKAKEQVNEGGQKRTGNRCHCMSSVLRLKSVLFFEAALGTHFHAAEKV